MLNKEEFCFILLPGFSPDDVPVLKIKSDIEKLGYAAIAANFWGVKPLRGHAPGGEDTSVDLSALTIEDCKRGVVELVKKAKQNYKYVVGIGISLGGALFIEYAKYHDDLFCIVSVGTPFKLKKQSLIKIGLIFLPIICFFWKFFQKIKSWRLLPLQSSKMIVNFLENDFLKNLNKVSVPILAIHSTRDYISDYRAVDKYLANISSEKKHAIYVDKINHVLEYNGLILIKYFFDFVSIESIISTSEDQVSHSSELGL